MQELVGVALGARHQKRMEAWLTELVNAVTELQKTGQARNWDELMADEAFIDVVLAATRAAEKTSRQAKLRALRIAVMTSASATAPGEDLERRFIDIVDRSTPDHLSLLLHLHDPNRSFSLGGVRWADMVQKAEDGLPWGDSSDPPLQIWAQYMRDGLLDALLPLTQTPADMTARLLRDVESWQLLGSDITLQLDATFLSPLGEQLLDYVGITGQTSDAFDAFGDANH